MPRNLSGVYSLPAGSIVVDGVDDIQASQHNQPLEDLRDDMNTARPIVAGGTGQTTIAGVRSAFGLVGTNMHCSVGGSANAITLTTGLGLSALVTGMRVSFVPGADNTGATTINVDGIGAVACRTVRNVALPSGYILTSFGIMSAVYNGTHWVVERWTEYGANSNGTFTKFDDGTMTCFHTVNTDSNGLGPWTFPAAYASAPRVQATAIAASDDRSVSINTATTTEVTIRGWRTVGTAWEGPVSVMAIGRWY
jgi:hypothetical protein